MDIILTVRNKNVKSNKIFKISVYNRLKQIREKLIELAFVVLKCFCVLK